MVCGRPQKALISRTSQSFSTTLVPKLDAFNVYALAPSNICMDVDLTCGPTQKGRESEEWSHPSYNAWIYERQKLTNFWSIVYRDTCWGSMLFVGYWWQYIPSYNGMRGQIIGMNASLQSTHYMHVYTYTCTLYTCVYKHVITTYTRQMSHVYTTYVCKHTRDHYIHVYTIYP